MNRRSITRRDCVKALAATSLAASVGGCAVSVTRDRHYDRPLSRKPFVAPRISDDRVVREVVGLRPYRPSGFVVRGEKFDDKTVIHNYGHGGGGITLSWGSSALAVRETTGMEHRNAAVVGGGIMGLTTARLLQDAGWSVTIYTKNVARHSTSNVARGQWAPTSVFEEGVATPAFESQFKWAAKISHHAYTNLGGPDYGVRWIENYYLDDQPFEYSYYLRELPELFASVADLGPDEHPFPVPYVRRTVTMAIEPATFLRRVTDDFYQAGGKFVIRDFADRSEILSLSEPVIFNCTGLGAAQLFGDMELTPVKGQLLFLPPDPAVDYWTIGGGGGLLYMFSRSDALVLGGTWGVGDGTTHADPAESRRILSGHEKLFAGFRA
jgi:glycine/D-amino acid oxidase-like deaminating enzyme